MSTLYRCRGICWIAVFLAGLSVARSQGVARLGDEFSILGSRVGDQVLPSISLTSSGGVVAFFNHGIGIDAAALGNSYTAGSLCIVPRTATATNDQVRPVVRELLKGNTVFLWQSKVLGNPDIYARFSKGTNFYTSDIRVNSYQTDQQVDPAAAALPDGGVMVAWASYGQDGSVWGVYARKLYASGAFATAQEFLVNQYTPGNQRKPAVCVLANGNIVVAWLSEGERFKQSSDIYARVFTPAGVPQTSEFLVNSATNHCEAPALTALGSGGFTAAWQQKDTNLTNSWDVWGRAFSANGTPAAAAFRINSYLYGDQYQPKLASAPNGVLAVWTSMGQDGSREGVFGRFLLGGKAVSGAEFQVNTTWVSQQLEPDVAWNGVDRFLVVWTSYTGLTYGFDLFGQLYHLTQ